MTNVYPKNKDKGKEEKTSYINGIGMKATKMLTHYKTGIMSLTNLYKNGYSYRRT